MARSQRHETVLGDAVYRQTRRAAPADEAEAREAYNRAVEVWNKHEKNRSLPLPAALCSDRFEFNVSTAPKRKHVWIVWACRDDGICIAMRTRRWPPFHEGWSCCRNPLRPDHVVRADLYEPVRDRYSA